jgi:tRNA threonylcarbamoyl adenosine modification protein YeaZ
MKTLALELSSSRGSVAWMAEGEAAVTSVFANDRKHSGLFFENLDRFSRQFGRPDAIVVGLGPGSYAGTRIAIAAAIGLQSAYDNLLFGLPSICAMQTEADEYCVVGDARRQSFFFAAVKGRQLTAEIVLYGEAELRQRVNQLGKEFPLYSAETLPQFQDVTLRPPSAAVLAQIIRDGVVVPREMPLEPIYLRDPHITVPKSVAFSITK